MASLRNSNTRLVNDLIRALLIFSYLHFQVHENGIYLLLLSLGLMSGLIDFAVEEITYKSTACRAHTASLTDVPPG